MLQQCYECQEEVIHLFLQQCKFCQESYCPSHFTGHIHPHLPGCITCHTEVMEHNSMECEQCDELTCYDCIESCGQCGAFFCQGCAQDILSNCDECNLELCQHCAKHDDDLIREEPEPDELFPPEQSEEESLVYCDACWESRHDLNVEDPYLK